MLMEVLIFAGVLGAIAVDSNVAVVVVVHVLVLVVREVVTGGFVEIVVAVFLIIYW